MSYDFEFDFDSFGNVVKNDVDLTDTELEDTYDPFFDEEGYWDGGCPIEDTSYLGEDGYAIDDDLNNGTQFYEDQLHDYERKLRDRIANNETIYSSQIDVYSDLFKDAFGIRPHGLMSWLTEYENIIDDYAEIRAKIEANRK